MWRKGDKVEGLCKEGSWTRKFLLLVLMPEFTTDVTLEN